MATRSDLDGQPVISGYNESRRINRALNELAGFLRGIVADNYVSAEETESLAKWLVANKDIHDTWPVRILADRIALIYQDGVADEEERGDLTRIIHEVEAAKSLLCYKHVVKTVFASQQEASA